MARLSSPASIASACQLRVRLAVLLAALTSAAARAQQPASPPPDATPRIREPIAPQPVPAAIAALARPAPIVLPFDRYTAVASTSWSHDPTTRSEAIDERFFECARTVRVSPDSARALAEAEPWREFDSAASAFPYVLFQVMPLDTPPVECGRSRADAPHYLQRGVVFTRTGIIAAENDIKRVDVLVDSSEARVTIAGRVPALIAGSRLAASVSARPVEPHQVRVYVPMTALDPHHGRFSAIALSVWSDSLPPIRIPVRSPLVNVLWHELVPWRIDEQRGAMTSTAATVPAVPEPNDAVLRAAVARYRSGAVADGAARAAAWRALDLGRSGGVDSAGSATLRRDRLIADVMVGGALAAVGDTTAAAAFAVDALASAPCLVPTTSSSSPYTRILTSVRPVARCTSVPSSAIVRRGLMFPGGGHAAVADRRRAVMAASLVTGVFAGAAVARWSASGRYSKYQDATSVDRAQSLYSDAVTMRNLATGLVVGGAAAWLGDIGYAILRERRHASRVRAEQMFGRAQ